MHHVAPSSRCSPLDGDARKSLIFASTSGSDDGFTFIKDVFFVHITRPRPSRICVEHTYNIDQYSKYLIEEP